MGKNPEPSRDGRLTRIGAVVYGADLEVGTWVARQIPGYLLLPGARALGVIKGNKLVAGVIFERCNGFHVEASIAAVPGSGWADRSTLFHLFHYPFVTLGCEAVTLTIGGTNLPSLNLATKLGFTPIAQVPFAAHDGSPLIVLQMYRDQCGWIENGQGQKRGTGTGGT